MRGQWSHQTILEMSDEDIQACLKATTWNAADRGISEVEDSLQDL